MTTASDSGVVVLDKPEGMTSHDVVARMRRVLGIRRVGHAGTLDPMATGVLVVGFGRATRLLPYLQGTPKRYLAGVRLGWATVTDDRTGEPLGAATHVALQPGVIDAQMARFVGPILQRPSAVSAVKVAGRRSYDRVRSGEHVELAPRPVEVAEFRRCSAPQVNDAGGLDFDAVVRCSSGTYVRALARDLGESLGCGAHLTALRRTAVGPFGIEDAHPVPDRADPAPPALDLAAAASAVLPAVVLAQPAALAAAQGQRIAADGIELVGPCALIAETGALISVAEVDEGRWRHLAVFASS